MEGTLRVSVLIPTYNRCLYLKECISSVLAQSVAPFEVVVIDDGSTDATSEVVAGFGPKIRYLRKENGGKPRALNFALPHLHGNVVWIFDDDDVAESDSIQARLEVLQVRPEIGFVLSGHYLGVDGPNGAISRVREYRLPNIASHQHTFELMKGCFATMQSMLVRTDVLRRAGSFDESLVTSEDYDMMLRLAAIAPFALLQKPTFIFRQHPGLRGPKGLEFSSANRQQVFRKYDAIVGKKLRASLSLNSYLTTPVNDNLLPADSQIEALCARMQVMASKGLIEEFFDDLQAVLHVAGHSGFGRIREIVPEAVCTGYAYDAIADEFPAVAKRLSEISHQRGGRKAALYFALGLLRLAKSYAGTFQERLQKMTLALLAVRAAFKRKPFGGVVANE